MSSFIESLNSAGLVTSEYDHATGWPKFMDLDRLVALQFPQNEHLQIELNSALKRACRRQEILSCPATAWAGLYLGRDGSNVPIDRMPETTDHAIDAPTFAEWLKRSDTEPSVHVAAWFTKFEIMGCVAEPVATAPAPATTPRPVVAAGTSDVKPWLVADPKDPKPDQSWYTPARYFARQLVIEDSTLLTKRLLLADKVSKSLAGAGIFKRGGTKPLSDTTVLKAFVNVALS